METFLFSQYLWLFNFGRATLNSFLPSPKQPNPSIEKTGSLLRLPTNLQMACFVFKLISSYHFLLIGCSLSDQNDEIPMLTENLSPIDI